ncbi:MAG: prepilin peptidase [Actinobacteria bacterium]|nr:prepilin peptidase [Actinomycetota bacterium]
MSTPLLLTMLGVYGLIVGSFVNVVIVRVPSEESILHPRSKCPLCQTPIALRDNVPVLSWVLLRGRCRTCREPIPVGYPLVELSNAVLWALAGVRFGAGWEVVPFAVLFSVLLALTVIDLELYLLPNAITYPAAIVSVLVIPPLALVATDTPRNHIVGALIGAVAYAGGLLLVLVLYELRTKRQGMGMGDVKLAVTLGLWLGYLHPILVLYGLLAASIVGLVVGAGILLVRRESRPYPFGPWLALGTVVTILASNWILDTFVNLN